MLLVGFQMSIKEEIDTKPIERQKFIEALESIADGLKGRLFSGRIVSNDDGTEIYIVLENGQGLH